MNEEQKSFPVRYMVVHRPMLAWYSPPWKVIDTLESGEAVCTAQELTDAHRIAKLLNESEGYVYEPN